VNGGFDMKKPEVEFYEKIRTQVKNDIAKEEMYGKWDDSKNIDMDIESMERRFDLIVSPEVESDSDDVVEAIKFILDSKNNLYIDLVIGQVLDKMGYDVSKLNRK